MENPKISVIVAIYNAERTLPRLLASLKAQTMQNFEALLIDDGSTDSSGAICDSYAEADCRFKVFHKPNEGIGATRQFGIEHATGEFTIHADADDWVEPDFIEQLYNKAVSSGTDMVICDILMENGIRTSVLKQELVAFDKNSLINDMICRLQNGPCNKLIRRSFYMDRNISFPKGLDIGEDHLFNLQLVMAGISVSYLPKALYHCDFVTNADSASRGSSLKKIQHRIKFVSALKELLPDGFEDGINDKYLDIAYAALKTDEFSKKQFKDNFSFLSCVKWKNYYKKAFSIKLILWTALNVSYNLAKVLLGIKNTLGVTRRKRK